MHRVNVHLRSVKGNMLVPLWLTYLGTYTTD